jgi:hypothetical protein
MKSLWPSSYKEVVKEASTEKRKQLDAMPSREKPAHRLNWHAASKSYTLNHNGETRSLSTEQVKSLFRGDTVSGKAPEDIEVLDEIVPPEITDMSKSEEDEIVTKDAADRHEHVDGTQSLPDGDNDEDDNVAVSNPEAQNHEPAPELPGEDIKCDETEPEVTKEAEPEAQKELELPAHIQTLLSSYNSLGAALGYPEITADMYAAAQHPAMQKDTGDLSAEQGSQCQMIHDMVCSMTKGAVCANSSQSVSDATDQAAMASNNTPMVSVSNQLDGDLFAKFDVLSKSIDAHHKASLDLLSLKGDADLTRKELEKARTEISTLSAEIIATQNTIRALKNMPLGNPVGHSRSTHAEDSTVQFKDMASIVESRQAGSDFLAVDSLKEALTLTSVKSESMPNGQYVMYRFWPAGVGGSVEKGVRPALTANHFQYMDFSDINAYRAGEAAKVPYIDNQVDAK